MEEWKECRLGDYCDFQNGYAFKSSEFKTNGEYKIVKIKELKDGLVKFFDDSASVDIHDIKEFEKYKIYRNDVLFALTGDPVSKPNPLSWVGRVSIYRSDENALLNQRTCKIKKSDEIDNQFLYYYFRQWENFYALASKATGSASQANISTNTIADTIIKLPPLPTQQKIADILSSLDDKIELNNKINTNLEQQAGALFKNWFANKIDNVSEKDGSALGTLIDIVDNRGKTPPSSNEKNDFPILDVGALNSTGRIINYKNCTKYVDEQTYSTFFRDGHPQDNDILISTVGSLAQMKFFKGNKGCIAQNVVAFRTLNTSPFYLYEYLKFIKNDLLAYDIGSVQPSIKVTHIIKHLIYIPTNDELANFDSFAKSITEQIYNNVCENERLISIRDTLLPKLMYGEIEV